MTTQRTTAPAPDDAYVKSASLMGTVVSMQVVGHGASQGARRARKIGVERAFAWFARVEQACSRFDAESDVRRLSRTIGTPVAVSDMLFEVVQFAVAVADASDGAFDPTVGHRLEARGFNREYKSGGVVRSEIDAPDDITWRDLELDEGARTITLKRPLLLDLGAVAKGLAVDMAARELAPFVDFAIDAGGDLFLGGHNADDQPWTVGIRHPRNPEELLQSLSASNVAVCTSGDYEQTVSTQTASAQTASAQTMNTHAVNASDEHHIINPKTGASPRDVASVTVMAPSAMVADALATAVFVLGPRRGLALLEQHEVAALIVTRELEKVATAAWPR